MSDEGRPIIVKRVKRKRHEAHGGQWKIAYADFVTAMMAFFLLMWLLSSASQGQLDGVSEYFRTPLKVALAGGPSSGASAIVLNGGGADPTRKAGQVKREGDLDSAREAVKAAEMAGLKNLQQKLEDLFEASQVLRQFREQILIDITDEGLRVQIVDEKNRPMFDNGSAALLPHTRQILREIGRTLNDVQHKVSLSGHTDATPYSSGEKGYSNWELSADRANASRRELISGGMNDAKVMRVVGHSSAALFNKTDPHDPVNRRISIIVLNKQTEASLSQTEAPSRQIEAPSSRSRPK